MSLKIAQGFQKSSKRVPKGCPLEAIVGHFGSTSGKWKIMVSCKRNHRFHGLRGSPGTSCAALCAAHFSIWSSRGCFLICYLSGLHLGAKTTKKHPRLSCKSTPWERTQLPYLSFDASWCDTRAPRASKICPRHTNAPKSEQTAPHWLAKLLKSARISRWR